MIETSVFERVAEKFGTPIFIYDEEKIRSQAGRLWMSFGRYQPVKILYAVKANSNPYLLKFLKGEGIWVDAVSPGEIALALKVGFSSKNILFTGNNITDEEMVFAMEREILLNIDSLSRLEKFGKKYRGAEVCVRINPDVGAGHHDHCITGGPKSKFGIWYSEVDKIKEIAGRYDLKIIGLHQHIGSQILDPDKFLMAMNVLLRVAKNFQGLEFLDFGGGLGVPYKPEEKPLDLIELGKKFCERFSEFCRKYGKRLTLIIEPGRYLVAEAGYLLTRVNTIKKNPDGREFVGVDSGFNHLIRPAMYGSYHQIVNLSNPYGKKEKVDIVGNLCESGDKFAEQREINQVREGDLLVIKNAGAYGFCMASWYNSRPRPAEVLVRSDRIELIRQRETIRDLIRGTKITNPKIKGG